MSLFSFLSGYRILRIREGDGAAFLNLCAKHRLVYREEPPRAGWRHFVVSETVAKRLLPRLEASAIPWECVGSGGSSAWFKALLRRPGLLLGSLLFVGILFFSSGVLWEVRVEGCQSLRENEVQDLLRSCGLRQGLWRSAVDTAEVENRAMILSDRISWMSVNIIGTVAHVEIRESIPTPKTGAQMDAANLVADRDGLILWMEDVRGNAAVQVGDDVQKGDLLVGGIYGSETDGFRYTVAKGRVYAKTHREFCVEIPLSYEKKVYTGRVKTEKYFIFFEKEVKFFGNSGNLYQSCDTIDTVEYLQAFAGEDLPVGVRTVRYLEYVMEPTLRDEEEAAQLAAYELKCLMEAQTAGAELLKWSRHSQVREEVYRVYAKGTYIENIAAVREIEITGITKRVGLAD